jgi:hypothetical protein
MRRWLGLFRPLIIILLALQVSTIYALPADAHLNLCIGYDGHFEISADSCAIVPDHFSRTLDPVLADEDHHGDCLDLTLGCSATKGLRPSLANHRRAGHQFPGTSQSSAPGGYFYPHPLQHPDIPSRTCSPPDAPVLPSAHLLPLRTTVLLI